MSEYNVLIRETLEKTVSVRANSQAEEKVRQGWNQSDHILTADDFVGVEFVVQKEVRHDCLIVRPNKAPERVTISLDLKTLQVIVGGDIELVYPFPEKVCIVCDEEGKLKDKPLNRALRDRNGNPYDIVSGDFLVVGLDEEDLCGLTPEQMNHYEQMYQQPEVFLSLGGEIVCVPYHENSPFQSDAIPIPETDMEL